MPTRIDEELNEWKARLATISRNLVDLTGEESTKSIEAIFKDPSRGFTGQTKVKAARALKALDELWVSYTPLSDFVEKATALHQAKSGMFRNNEEKLRELLDGESVVLPAEHAPLENRDLLGDADKSRRVRPSELLAAMQLLFQEARDGLDCIAEADERIRSRLSVMEKEAAVLAGWAKTLGAPDEPSFDISGALARVEADPIGCAHEVDGLEAGIAARRTRLQAIAVENKAVRAALEGAGAMIAELKDLVTGSRAAMAEARREIAGGEGFAVPMGDEEIQSLEAWLYTLGEHANAGRYKAVKIGAAKLELELKARLDMERGNYERNRAMLDERADLKGRYKALCVKARVMRERGLAPEGAVDDLSARARQALDTRPFDIRAARQAVDAFESAL